VNLVSETHMELACYGVTLYPTEVAVKQDWKLNLKKKKDGWF